MDTDQELSEMMRSATVLVAAGWSIHAAVKAASEILREVGITYRQVAEALNEEVARSRRVG